MIETEKKKNEKLRLDELIVLSINYIPNGIYILLFGLLHYKVTKYLVHTINFTVSKVGWNKGLWEQLRVNYFSSVWNFNSFVRYQGYWINLKMWPLYFALGTFS